MQGCLWPVGWLLKPLKMAEVSCTVQAFEILYGAR
jgi:hypothetical protein